METLPPLPEATHSSEPVRLPLASDTRGASITATAMPTYGVNLDTPGAPLSSPRSSRHPNDRVFDTTVPWQVFDQLVETYAPPTLLVDHERHLLWATGKASPYLKNFSGQCSPDVVQMVVDDLTALLATALDQAATTQQEAIYTGIQVRTEAGVQHLTLRVQCLQGGHAEAVLLLVILESAQLAWLSASAVAAVEKEQQTAQSMPDMTLGPL